jgi:PHD/YefM family antitoxin component YafN of YafNO toxin-antitoxin module
MKTIDLQKEKLDLQAVISFAEQEPVLLLTTNGKEFFISEADDFEKEVEELRASAAFQKFLDQRSASKVRIPLEEIEKEIDEELEEQKNTAL